VLIHWEDERCDDSVADGCLRIYLGASLAAAGLATEDGADFILARSVESDPEHDGTSAMFLEDATGDGLSDILQITPGHHGVDGPVDGTLRILDGAELPHATRWNDDATLSLVGDAFVDLDYPPTQGDFDGDTRPDLAAQLGVWPDDSSRDASAMALISATVLDDTGTHALLDSVTAIYWSESERPDTEFLFGPRTAADLDGDGQADLAFLPYWTGWVGVWAGSDIGDYLLRRGSLPCLRRH
jgi:hypothetical protein